MRVIDFTVLEIDYVREVTRLQMRFVDSGRTADLTVAT